MFKRLISFCAAAFAASQLMLYAKDPYYIKGEIVTSGGGEYSYAGLEIRFYNKSDLPISSFTVVYRLSDYDGLSPFDMEYIFVNIDEYVPPDGSIRKCISLDDLFDEAPDAEYEVDRIFVDKIMYEDGTVWED